MYFLLVRSHSYYYCSTTSTLFRLQIGVRKLLIDITATVSTPSPVHALHFQFPRCVHSSLRSSISIEYCLLTHLQQFSCCFPRKRLEENRTRYTTRLETTTFSLYKQASSSSIHHRAIGHSPVGTTRRKPTNYKKKCA